MDFVNAVYISLLSTDTVKLQYIPNAAARLIGALPKCSHISGIIRDSLLWLPIMHIHIYISKPFTCTYVQLPHWGDPKLSDSFLHSGLLAQSCGCSAYVLC